MEATLGAGALALIPVIMVLVSLAKNYIDSKWSPLIALGISLAAAFSLVPLPTIAQTVLEGVIMSLTASGLYSSAKTTARTITE